MEWLMQGAEACNSTRGLALTGASFDMVLYL